MEQTLAYLRESLSNWTEENELAQHIYNKLEYKHYKDEEAFVRDLDEHETLYLNKVLKKEMRYADNEDDGQRLQELNNVYEHLI